MGGGGKRGPIERDESTPGEIVDERKCAFPRRRRVVDAIGRDYGATSPVPTEPAARPAARPTAETMAAANADATLIRFPIITANFPVSWRAKPRGKEL